MDDKLNLSVDSSLSESRRRSNRTVKPKRYSPEPVLPKYASIVKKSATKESSSHQNSPMETHLEEIKLQNLSEFYRESLSTLSSLTETNFDVKDLLPKKKRISAKQEKEQMELMPSSSKRRMEPPFELAQSSYDWPHIEATDTDVSKHPELKRIFSQQHGTEEQAPKKKAALKKNARKLLSQSLTGLVSEKLLESEKSGSERKSATRSRRSAEKLVDTSIVARPELMPEKSELGKKPITESLMPASTEKLVDTSIVAEPELVPEKSEPGKKPIARVRRSTEKLDASTSEDPIEPTQHASQSIVASKKKPATKKSDEKAPDLTEVELLPEKSERAKPVIRIRRSTEISDTGESIDRLQVSVAEPAMEKSSPKKPKENFSLSQPGTKLEKSTKPIVGARRSKGMSSSASPATSEISLASTRQPRNKSKSVFELLSPAIVGKRKSSTASKPPSVPPPRAGAETSLSSTSIAPLNIPDYMENQTPVPSIYDSDARQDKLTGLSAFMRHRRDSESSVDLSEHVSGVSSAVQYPRMTVTPGSVGNRVRTLSKAKEILRKDDQSTLTPVKAKKEISPKKSAEKIKMQKEDGEKAMEEKFDLEKEMPDVIVAVPPFIEECETPIVEEPVEYIETGQAEISQKKAKKVTTFEVKKKKTEQRHVFSQSAKAVEPMTTRSMSFKSDGRRRSFAVSQSELRPRSSTLSTISPLPERMQKFHDEFTSALSHSLIHGREPRNKSKPVLELAPSLIKQEKRKLSADTLGPAKRRRTTITDASDILTPPTEPLQISIPSSSVPDISATLKEATETLLKSLPPRPELPPIPQIPVFPDVSAAAASTTTPSEKPKSKIPDFSIREEFVPEKYIRDRAGRSSKQPKHRVFKHHPSQPTTPAQSEISEAQFDFPQKPQQDRYPAYGRVETQPNLIEMSIFDRLAKRKINPLAMGVVPRKEKDYEKEFFYREIFMRNPKHEDEPNEPLPDEIDVVEEEEPITDEVLQTNPADACANDIVAILPRISKVPTEDDSDSESMEYTIDELKELAQYEPQIVSNHLLVLLKWIANQRLTDISTLNVTGGCSMFHSLTLRNANRTREALKLYSNKLMDSIVVAHDWLLPRLATPLLASYLNLLRFLHVAGSGVTKHVTNHDEKRDEKINEANKIIREFSLTKVQDPLGKSIKDNLDRLEKRVNASVLFVSPKITTPNYNPKIRAHETISQMLPTCTKMFESLKLEFVDVQGPINVENLTHMCIKLIKKKVKELVKRRPNDHIFLAGWGTTCLLNHAAVQEVKGVSGLLDFAFPSQTVYGPRGDVEDEILLTYCPTLFIVGEHASDCSLKDLQKLRENMTQENGLIVVGGANSNLYVNALRLSMERVSQRCVARTILEHVVDFMQEVITVAPPPVYSHQALKPIAVVNPFDVETSSLKPSRSEKSSTSAAGGESSKIKGTTSQSAASQAIIQARKEKLKKNQDALLQEKLRNLAADAIQPKKSVVSKMRTIAMKPEEIKRSLSQTPLTSPFSQKPQIKQHLQQNLQNPKKQKEFTQIFGEPINLTPARIDFGNKLRQATSSTSAPSHQVYSQQVQPSTSSQPQNRDREETLREEAAAVAALSTQSFITSFPDEPVESMDYDEYGKLL